jgi:hypothetical protein
MSHVTTVGQGCQTLVNGWSAIFDRSDRPIEVQISG